MFEPIDRHHVFGGPYRKLSEKYGLTVYLHHNACHIFGENSVHNNRAIRDELCTEAQKAAMEYFNWTTAEFIERFGMNWIKE